MGGVMLGCMKVEVEAKIYLLRFAFRMGFIRVRFAGMGGCTVLEKTPCVRLLEIHHAIHPRWGVLFLCQGIDMDWRIISRRYRKRRDNKTFCVFQLVRRAAGKNGVVAVSV